MDQTKSQNFWDLDQTHGGTLAAGDTDRAAWTKQRQAYVQRLAHLQAYECDTPELDNQDEFNVLKEWNHTEMRLWGPHPKTATGRIIAWQAMPRNLAPMVRGHGGPFPLKALDISGFAAWRFLPSDVLSKIQIETCDFPHCDVMDKTACESQAAYGAGVLRHFPMHAIGSHVTASPWALVFCDLDGPLQPSPTLRCPRWLVSM